MDSIILDAPQKQCNACLEFLPATPQFFFRARLGLYGVRSVCKKCEKAGRPITKLKLPDGHKRCFKCKQILPHECFSKSTKNKDGLQRHCKVCERAYGRQAMT